MREVVDGLSLGLVLLNEEGQVEYANRFCRERGIVPDDYAGKRYYEVFRSLELMSFVGEGLEGRSKELRFEHSGRVYRATFLKGGLAVQIEDITELVKLERLQREFSASVSHELSTPITAVKGLLETALSGNKPDRELLERALKRVRELEGLIKALRYMVSLEGDHQTSSDLFSAKELLEDVIQDLKGEMELLEIKVELACEGVELRTDRDRAYILLRNIVENAVKHNRRGGKVRIECERTPDRVEIRVKDTGEGIAREELPLVFQPFYRGKGKKGMGLGLAIAKRVAELLGAELEISSEEGKGTTVRVIFMG
ncbi:HAMP domain-containing sensor histidine kinase [Hydrogenivirga sp. 128-5-R1-1]|uniref:sensor histidine kinase n=1 Tax=Hydrogenivirga sp. 128-5-R1-1 TaxID=392423 RepID=UPI00015F16D1|nr:HAMP domain-containing sensor histidine kinase [Hydrogenivirga sp. 128-5-R1-1]EDP76027.1 histidine kinase sensor protein [Hydrogenivirga sp. 128-5-R1-1]